MTEILPFRPGMTIGRAYDLRNHTIGLDIIPEEYTANPQRVQCPSTIVKYQVIKKSSDVNNILEVSGDISLKVKAGILNVQGIGSYLREDRSKENALEILAIAHVETISTTLKNPQLATNWNKSIIGTHYIRSVIYGADLVISIRIIAADSKSLEDIKANVDSKLQIQGIINAEAKANFKKLEEDLKDSSEIKFGYYCTIPGISIPKDVDTMLKTLDDFQNELKNINNGDGAPLKCEMVSLSLLTDNFPTVLRQTGLEAQLRELEQMYDELRQAKSMLHKCLEDDVEHMNDEQQLRLIELDNRIQEVMSCFSKAISRIDVTTAGNSLDEIQQAVTFYRKNVKLVNFQAEVKLFIKQVLAHKSKSASGTPIKDLPHGEPLSIIFLGKTGHGKSATCNSIFGTDRFCSTRSAVSVSLKCQMAISNQWGREICLVDTPGVMDTRFPDKALQEIGTAIAYQPHGFHAFMFVINIDARITKEEQMAITMLKSIFGKTVIKQFGIFVFTHGDSFKKDMKKRKNKITFEEYIKSQEGYIQSVLKECNYRCSLIDNLEEDPGLLRDQVITIITLIDDLVKGNNGKMYTSHIFEKAQQLLEEKKTRFEKTNAELKRKRDKDLEAIRNQGNAAVEKQIKHVEAMYDAKLKENAEMQEAKEEIVGKEITEGMSCFPPDVLVKLDDGRTITIADLRTGQKVLSSSSSGTLEYSEVYFFAHLNPDAINKYIILNTCNQTLRLSPEHHIYVVRHGHLRTIAAREVNIGDNVIVVNNNVSSLIHEPVREISESIEVGVYAPITMSGAIVVNNVLASCYVDIVPPVYSHTLLWPMRQLYRLSPSLAARINVVGKKGMPAWVQFVMNNILA